jgi:hypothetical protein
MEILDLLTKGSMVFLKSRGKWGDIYMYLRVDKIKWGVKIMEDGDEDEDEDEMNEVVLNDVVLNDV